jgi:hypothetical protein
MPDWSCRDTETVGGYGSTSGDDEGTGSQKRSNGVNEGNEEENPIVFSVFSVGFVAPFLKSGTSGSLRCLKPGLDTTFWHLASLMRGPARSDEKAAGKGAS